MSSPLDHRGHQKTKITKEKQNMKYFANVKTLDELKAEYRRLCMKHHRRLSCHTAIPFPKRDEQALVPTDELAEDM